MASFTSQVGDYLTGSAEVVFGLPGDLNYSKNGMIYGARLYDATRSLRISDPEFAANLDEHFRQCVFYDVLLGRYSMKELAETGDIWATIAPGSQGCRSDCEKAAYRGSGAHSGSCGDMAAEPGDGVAARPGVPRAFRPERAERLWLSELGRASRFPAIPLSDQDR